MIRYSTGFVSKKPHRKSRGGCLACKRKKVKCDEAQPACGYCSLRKLNCKYPQDPSLTSRSQSSTPPSTTEVSTSNPNTSITKKAYLNDPSAQITPWLTPASHTSIGDFTILDHKLLHYYKSRAWRSFVVREETIVHTILKDLVPRLGISHPHLLYALLSIAATHSNTMYPDQKIAKQALVYRQKTFQVYQKTLKDITAENYEAVLVTGTFLLTLVPPPEENKSGNEQGDDEYFSWLHSLLKLSEGLRVLASLRWAQGIEKLSVYPLICRELRTLPPPPVIEATGPDAPAGCLGTTPEHPNPAPTYHARNPKPTRLFLPPPLLNLLEIMTVLAPIDVHCAALLPAFHALSPIFLSLYYFHLNTDFYVRIVVFPSFLMPDFLKLVKVREPRALVLVAWWFALANLIPGGWWVGSKVGNVVGAIGRAVKGYSSREQGSEGLVDRVFKGAQ
ncbi:hypothetical protein EJ02DRAFT_370757, partial [Clathrospora elynae]